MITRPKTGPDQSEYGFSRWCDGVTESLRHSASNHARSTRVGSNPVVGSNRRQ